MKEKSLTLVAGTEQTRVSLVRQLKEYISDLVAIKSIAIDEGIEKPIKDKFVVLSSNIVKKELEEKGLLADECHVIVAKRTINYETIDEIVFLPKNTDVLFVNDVKETTYESINTLKELGIDYLNFIPYYPGIRGDIKEVDIAITPGECDKVPPYIETTYDIGPRIMDFTTIIKILNNLGILEHKAGQFSRHYLQKIINMAKKLARSANQISNLNEHLKLVINGLNDALLVYDFQGNISVINENLMKMLNINKKNVIGRNIKDIIYNKSLLSFLMNKDLGEKKIFTIDGQEIMVNKFQLLESNFLICVFKNLKETIKNNNKIKGELIRKGYYAKYTFDDIIGQSQKILKVKRIAKKLARTELTILLEGESGTGKELFASAIHNASRRSNGPFLAANFSALPDELVESELFGYEEGAFTGAKKGGKPGLFEQADGGTIFLDEIGDITSKVQARLLRVLQEKEVMRIGGNEIKPVDVRIIAATNRDLARLVNEGMFREDLYYRLKMGYIRIPPLRERKEDLIELLNYFIEIENAEEIKIAKEVIEELLQYNWYGNVRELKNTLTYMLAVREDNCLTLEDIPERDFFQKGSNVNGGSRYLVGEVNLKDELCFLLQKINELNDKGKLVGRRLLADEIKGTKHEMTVHQIRNRLDKLEKRGLIIKKRGRHGTVLTAKGRKFCELLFHERG